MIKPTTQHDALKLLEMATQPGDSPEKLLAKAQIAELIRTLLPE